MSKMNIVLGIALLLTTGIAGIFAFKTSEAVSEPRWEYMIVSVPDSMFNEQLNKLGASGWEMVFARRASDGNAPHPTMSYEMIFKRHAHGEAQGIQKRPSLLP